LKWDQIAASNGMGFHSPAEALRILAGAVDLANQARLDCARILARHGYVQPVGYPDFSTKGRPNRRSSSLPPAIRRSCCLK